MTTTMTYTQQQRGARRRWTQPMPVPPPQPELKKRAGSLVDNKKTLRFNELVRVVLIPARRDYDPSTFDQVWFSREDMAFFRRKACQDMLRPNRDDSSDVEDNSSAAPARAAAGPVTAVTAPGNGCGSGAGGECHGQRSAAAAATAGMVPWAYRRGGCGDGGGGLRIAPVTCCPSV